MKAVLFIMLLSMSVIFAADDAKLKLGVVDMGKVVEEYEMSVQMLSSLEKRQEEVRAQAEKINTEVQNMKTSLKIVSKAKQEELFSLIRRKNIELKIMQEAFREEVNVKREKYYIMVYAEIEKAIKIYGQDKKLDLVFRKNLPKARPDIQESIVLYSSTKFDITEDVIKVLNTKYRQDKVAETTNKPLP